MEKSEVGKDRRRRGCNCDDREKEMKERWVKGRERGVREEREKEGRKEGGRNKEEKRRKEWKKEWWKQWGREESNKEEGREGEIRQGVRKGGKRRKNKGRNVKERLIEAMRKGRIKQRGRELRELNYNWMEVRIRWGGKKGRGGLTQGRQGWKEGGMREDGKKDGEIREDGEGKWKGIQGGGGQGRTNGRTVMCVLLWLFWISLSMKWVRRNLESAFASTNLSLYGISCWPNPASNCKDSPRKNEFKLDACLLSMPTPGRKRPAWCSAELCTRAKKARTSELWPQLVVQRECSLGIVFNNFVMSIRFRNKP